MRRSLLTLLLLALAMACPLAVAPAAAAAPGGAPGALREDALTQDEKLAVQAVDTFWRHYFARTGRPYDSPRVLGGYTGTSGPKCAGEPSVPGNALYCFPGDYIAWDDQLMSTGYRKIGDAWVYLVIAHEWGHAIQARLDRSQVSVAAELQADCLAGAALLGAVHEGTIRLEDGDTQELSDTLAAVADDYPWTDASSHGNATERMDAFDRGARGGVRACV